MEQSVGQVEYREGRLCPFLQELYINHDFTGVIFSVTHEIFKAACSCIYKLLTFVKG